MQQGMGERGSGEWREGEGGRWGESDGLGRGEGGRKGGREGREGNRRAAGGLAMSGPVR